MTRLSEIIKERSEPGLLIFDHHGRLLYSNREALEMESAVQAGATEAFPPFDEIYSLCLQMKTGAGVPDPAHGVDPECPVLNVGDGISYSLRSFLINERAKENGESHILILIEKVVERRKIDIEYARREFQLTKREGDVLKLICQGLPNREISETIFISEYTVKVHIKNIMKKMKANSRNEIIALLK